MMPMKIAGFDAWRVSFVVAALFILIGGPQHPGGATMADMLADPAWVRAHVLVLAGFLALLLGLTLLGRGAVLPPRTRGWLRVAIIGTALQAVEMVFHTASVVDYEHLVAGHATPVLTTHMALAVIFYPIFGATMIGLIVAAMRDRVIGSPWIAWLGIIGAAAHGMAPPLVVALNIIEARILFPMVMLFALWLILAAAWPSSVSAARPENVEVRT